MRKKWFARQKRFDGKYAPAIFYDSAPSNKKATGEEVDIKDIHEVPEYLDHLTLNELNDYFEPSKETTP
jgi:hypothetical protein